ncbi:MAG: type II secretion system F family protein [Planctomycetota bacterium]
MDLRAAHTVLFKKFAHFYDAGVPLTQALEIAARDLGPELREAVQGVMDDIYRGSSLADAFQRRPELFGADLVGLVRAGEARGDLSTAARSIASGLAELILDPAALDHAGLESLLEKVKDGGVLHLDAGGAGGGRVRLREEGGLREVARLDVRGVVPSICERAGIDAAGGEGVFLWGERVVRVGVVTDGRGPSAVLRVSGPVPDAPREVAAWQRGPPTLMVVAGPIGSDKDALLWSVVRAASAGGAKVVGVGFPVPEAVAAPDLQAAVAQDPDVVCLGLLRRRDEVQDLGRRISAGLRAVAGFEARDARAARRQLEVWILRDLVGPVVEGPSGRRAPAHRDGRPRS